MLDTSFLLGNVPARATTGSISAFDAYFCVARGHASAGSDCCPVHAGEMTKWFDTNYHYIVPEFSSHTTFDLNADGLLQQINEVRALGGKAKPVILGPLSYLFLGKATDDSDPLLLLDSLLVVYQKLLDQLSRAGVEWVQLDEPALVTELPAHWQTAYKYAYQYLARRQVKVLLTTYFGELQDNLELVCQLPVDGVHIDGIRAKSEVTLLAQKLKRQQVLSVGIIDGRNVWKTDLNAALTFLQPLAEICGENLWLAPSCSLLHVPVNLAIETDINSEVKDWLAFAVEKLQELRILAKALTFGPQSVETQLAENRKSINSRKSASIVHNPKVKRAQQAITPQHRVRSSSYHVRRDIQNQALSLPLYPTTTIGSFPQTADICATRQAYRQGNISQ
ncbi:MAG: 5-methyltetrahydropteroyltriglutamate--homocysteine methyltransferase [Paraglaciecola sp.]